MRVEIEPRTLRGPWASGFALHIHAISSEYVGEDPRGRARFSTARSPVGELLYRLKYQGDKKAVDRLAEAAAGFCCEKWQLKVDAIVPVPPSLARRIQPVMAVAAALAELLDVPICDGVKKVKRTPQLKDLKDYDKRVEALRDAFDVDCEKTVGKRLLLVDDIYGSGATVRMITQLLVKQGGARAVHLLTLTRRAGA